MSNPQNFFHFLVDSFFFFFNFSPEEAPQPQQGDLVYPINILLSLGWWDTTNFAQSPAEICSVPTKHPTSSQSVQR